MATRSLAAKPAKPQVQQVSTLQSSQLELYKRIFAEAADAIAIISPDGKYLEQNSAHEQLTGYPSIELQGQSPAVHLGEETFQRIAAELAQTGHFRGEVTSRDKSGCAHAIDLLAFSVPDASGEVTCFVGIKRDIGDRKRVEQELNARIRELEAVYSLIRTLDRADDVHHVYEAALDAVLSATHADRAAILIYDSDDKMHFKASRGLSAEYRTAVDGHSPWQRHQADAAPIMVPNVMLDESLAEYRATIVTEGIVALGFIPIAHEGRLLGKFMLYFNQQHEFRAEEVRVAQALAAPVAAAIERRRADEALRVSERLATAGRLAATIAHEINNPLEAVTNLAYLARTVCKEPETLGYLNDLDRELARVSGITRQTLAFYRESGAASVFDAAAVALELLHIYEYKLGKKQVQVKTACEAAPVYFVIGELRQILANILANAIDAIYVGGELSVSSFVRDEYSEIVVRDNGVGISDAHLRRLYQPFFTTKQQAGTGLGLWVSKQLLEKNGGSITIGSSTAPDDHGTTVRLVLPTKPSNL